MSAAVKYGLVGALVALVILITQYYIIAENTASHPAFKYLIQLTLFVSIIASIKVTKDREIPGGAIDLKSGLRAGVITSILIIISVSSSFFCFYKTMNPVKDTTIVNFNRLIS